MPKKMAGLPPLFKTRGEFVRLGPAVLKSDGKPHSKG